MIILIGLVLHGECYAHLYTIILRNAEVSMAYIRKTIDEYEIQGNYGLGWECVTTEDTWKDAKAQVKCYRENESYSFRIRKKRVPKPTLPCNCCIR